MFVSHDFQGMQPVRQRRRFPRFAVQCRARILIGKRQYAGYIHNISEGGAKLRTVSSIRRIGKVVLRLPDLPPLRCRLSWTDAYHAGVVFELRLTKAQLRHWVESRAAFAELNKGPEAECELVEVTDEPLTDGL
jgi:hypothetical protein